MEKKSIEEMFREIERKKDTISNIEMCIKDKESEIILLQFGILIQGLLICFNIYQTFVFECPIPIILCPIFMFFIFMLLTRITNIEKNIRKYKEEIEEIENPRK